MTSCNQTVVVTVPQSNLLFHSMEARPVAPPGLVFDGTSAQQYVRGSGLYTWDKNQVITLLQIDGKLKIWHPRPTIQDSFSYGSGNLFQFHKDGSITARISGSTYYWSIPFNMPHLPIQYMDDEHYCLYTRESSTNTDCPCYDDVYERVYYGGW